MNAHNNIDLGLVTPADAAKALGVSTSTLAKWRLSGEGPTFLKLGARIAYDPEHLRSWVRGRVRASTSDLGSKIAGLR